MSQLNHPDPEGLRLPIKIDTTSNGEFIPVPLSRANRLGNRVALEEATSNARRVGQNRRRFLLGSAGAATTLLAMNRVNASAGKTGGFFDLPEAAAVDHQLAAASVAGDEFIFDVQGHYVDPNGSWLKQVPEFARPFSGMPKADCDLNYPGDPTSYLDCLGPKEFVKDVFLDSDTDMMVLSFVPSTADAEPVTIEAADATRQIVEDLEGSKRLLLHGRVNPNQEGDLDRMEALANQWNISAWKTYTQFGPDGSGYYLSDDVGLAFIEGARDLGVKVICIHKGLPLGRSSYDHSKCTDIGVVAKQYPDMSFIVYHSGYVAGRAEKRLRRSRGWRRHSCEIPARQRRRAKQRTSMRNSAVPGVSSCASRTTPPTCSASCSNTAAKITCCGVPTPSGMARRRIRSRPSARFRSMRGCAKRTAIRN